MSLEYRDPPEPPKKQSNTEFTFELGGDEAEYAAGLDKRNFAQWQAAKELKLKAQKQRNDLIGHLFGGIAAKQFRRR